jgi:hypothetical protein
MLVSEDTLRRLLGGEGELVLEQEAPGRERAWIAGQADALIVRRHPDDDSAVGEALANAGFAFTPQMVGLEGFATLEREFPGVPLSAIEASASAMDQCIDALVEFHNLPVREGLGWEQSPGDRLPSPDVPLHRLGFTSAEREPAEPWFVRAHEALLPSPFGFTHGACRANNVLVANQGVAFVNFEQAGFGAQYMDVAFLLATSGLSSEERRRLAARYARRAGRDEATTIDLVDLATIAWGVEDLLELPRRQIVVMGDDAAMDSLLLMAARTERALREPAGDHPAASAIRSALWPRRD